jgi:hypothetical protein
MNYNMKKFVLISVYLGVSASRILEAYPELVRIPNLNFMNIKFINGDVETVITADLSKIEELIELSNVVRFPLIVNDDTPLTWIKDGNNMGTLQIMESYDSAIVPTNSELDAYDEENVDAAQEEID